MGVRFPLDRTEEILVRLEFIILGIDRFEELLPASHGPCSLVEPCSDIAVTVFSAMFCSASYSGSTETLVPGTSRFQVYLGPAKQIPGQGPGGVCQLHVVSSNSAWSV
jgi:hypothetical protein